MFDNHWLQTLQFTWTNNWTENEEGTISAILLLEALLNERSLSCLKVPNKREEF